jgi:acetyl-CoA carboxylase carboxyl transferase subunit alpha
MASALSRLAFERPIVELEESIKELESRGDDRAEAREQVRKLRRELADLRKNIYNDLSPWQTVQVARHPDRPMLTDYINLLFDEFVELHGDRFFGDDRAIRAGFAKLDQFKVLLVGHYKGKTLEERQQCYFGCAHPEGYRKALGKMKLAAKYGLPVICMIDTPGAYPGVGAEERGQAQVIAENMFEMSRLNTPIICVVIGEGGSGGALGIGVGDRVGILQHAYYSVISPEGCAGILWKSGEYAEQAAEALKLSSRYLADLGAVDDVIEEPVGGAHLDHHQMTSRLKIYLVKTLQKLVKVPMDELLEARYAKFRALGVFFEDEHEVSESSQSVSP